jgi:sec-independent protein translocase protein TatA
MSWRVSRASFEIGESRVFGIGSQELLIIFLVVLLLFGADRIPEVARALGKSIRDFKRAAGDIESEIQQVTKHKDLLSGETAQKGRREGGPSKPTEKPAAGAKGEAGSDEAPEARYTGRGAGDKAPSPHEDSEPKP